MATYECSICDMVVTLTCAKCDVQLKHSYSQTNEDNAFQVSECPNGHGEIKSPMCCWKDMFCTAD